MKILEIFLRDKKFDNLIFLLFDGIDKIGGSNILIIKFEFIKKSFLWISDNKFK